MVFISTNLREKQCTDGLQSRKIRLDFYRPLTVVPIEGHAIKRDFKILFTEYIIYLPLNMFKTQSTISSGSFTAPLYVSDIPTALLTVSDLPTAPL